MWIAACSIAAAAELAHARVLAESWRRHHPGVPFYLLLADAPAAIADPAREPFHLLLPHQVAAPPGLAMGYGRLEYSYALTPWLLRHLLDAGCDAVLFLKQESLVTGQLDDVLATLPAHAITLMPHHLAPLEGPDAAQREMTTLMAGVANGGLLGVASRPEARRFLDWWCGRLLHDCRHALIDGLHYEQRCLDLVPCFFTDIAWLTDPTIGIGHWNLPERAALLPQARHIRFSGFDYDQPEVLTRYNPASRVAPFGQAALATWRHYRALAEQAGHAAMRCQPWVFGSFANGVPIPALVRHLWRTMPEAEQARFGDPFAVDGPASLWRWLTTPMAESALTPLWHFVWQGREDLRRAFPWPCGRDYRAFLAWTRTYGLHEAGLPEALAGPAP